MKQQGGFRHSSHQLKINGFSALGYINSSLFHKYAHMIDGYDIVCSFMPDDRTYLPLNDFFECQITDTVLLSYLSATSLKKQHIAKTQKACDQISIENTQPILQSELILLNQQYEKERSESLMLYRDLRVKHRREGKFFDEIMKGI